VSDETLGSQIAMCESLLSFLYGVRCGVDRLDDNKQAQFYLTLLGGGIVGLRDSLAWRKECLESV